MNSVKVQNEIGTFGELTIKRFKNGELLETAGPYKNKVVSSSGYGRNIIARQLAGDTTYTLEIDSMSIGDGTATPVDADTDLANVLDSGIPLTDISASGSVVSIDVFVADGNLADDTYSEVGFYANSRLISRILISPSYTKATGEDTLFSYTLNING